MANVISPDLVKTAIADSVEFEAQKKLSMLPMFCRDFKDLAVSQQQCALGGVVIPFASGLPEARENPTTFGASSSVKVDPIKVTMGYINVEAKLDLADVNKTGISIDQFAGNLAYAFCAKCIAKIVALLTTTNFTKALDYDSAAYDTEDKRTGLINTLYGSLTKGSRKYLLGNSSLFANFIAKKQYDYDAIKNPAVCGFDGVYECNDFGEDVAGILTDGRGIAISNRLLDWGPDGNAALKPQAVVDAVTGLNYQICSWYDTTSRATWYSIDAAFGCAVMDKAATKIIGVAAGGE